MLHLLYILAFTLLAFMAIRNLIGNLIRLSRDSQRPYTAPRMSASQPQTVPHPELLDNTGRVTNEPLLVMRSVNVDEARAQLDALYDSSPADRDA